ncbi:MAG: ABC transporter substrate-binding protein [Brevinematales bacterium]|jgi:branched-chain amino acid transport system substrate-binding protein
MKYCLFAVLSMFLFSSLYGSDKDQSLKIGGNYEITGSVATFGTSCANAARLFFDKINSSGGLLGKKVELIIADNKSDPSESASAVKMLIAQDKVAALLGPVISRNSLTAAPIAQDAGYIMITPTATNPDVTKTGKYIFRACFIDDFQGTVMANFALKNLRVKTAAVFLDNANDYSKGLAKFFKESFIKGGGKIVSEEAFIAGDKDFRTQLTKIRMKKPDIIYIPAYYQEDGLIAKQARELSIATPILGGDGWDSDELIKIAGAGSLNGIYFSNHYSTESVNPVAVDFIKAYRQRYGSRPDALAALSYDSALILSEAIKAAGSTETEKIREALVKLKVSGVTGRISFDENRNPVKSAVVIELVNGSQVYKTTIEP